MSLPVEHQLRQYFLAVDHDQDLIDVETLTASPLSSVGHDGTDFVQVIDDRITPDREEPARRLGATPLALDQEAVEEVTDSNRSTLLLAAAVAIAVIVGVYFVVTNRTDDSAPVITDQPAPEAITIAEKFMDARGRWDGGAIRRLVAENAVIDGEIGVSNVDEFAAVIAFERAMAWRITESRCTRPAASDPFVVSCSYTFENAWSRALETGPFPGSSYELVVEGGQIQEVRHDFAFAQYTSDAWRPFRTWLLEHHPDDHDVMYTSPDGTWARTTPEAIALWEERTGEFVAGQGTAESADAAVGESFPPGSWLYDVAASSSLLVAVGSDGVFCCGTGIDGDAMPESSAAVWTSTDGENWFRVPHDESVFGGPGGQAMFAVTATADGFVAGGVDAGQTQTDAAVWTSADGLTWQRVPDPDAVLGGAGQQRIKAIASSEAGLVAIGFQEKYAAQGLGDTGVWTSDDGSEWTLVDAGEAPDTDANVVSSASGFTAIGPDVWESADGVTWSQNSSAATPPFWFESVLGDGATLIGVETSDTVEFPSGQRLWRSVDGSEWVRDEALRSVADSSSRVVAIVSFEGGYVGVGVGTEGTDHLGVAGPLVTADPPAQ